LLDSEKAAVWARRIKPEQALSRSFCNTGVMGHLKNDMPNNDSLENHQEFFLTALDHHSKSENFVLAFRHFKKRNFFILQQLKSNQNEVN
jgi:hypothetical protein